MPIPFRPIGAQILIRAIKKPRETMQGGLYVPSKEEGPIEGIVETLGAGRRDEHGKLILFEVTPGDRVLFARYGGTEVKVGDVSYTLITEDNILGILS